MGAAIVGQKGPRDARPDRVRSEQPLTPADTNSVYAKEAVGSDNSGEVIEKDTEDAEDSLSLNDLLLPPMVGFKTPLLPLKVAKFSVCYSVQCLNGWVKQPSPCCAAASVAGAWNAVFDLPRSDPQALSHREVLDVYINHLSALITTKINAFERRLGASLDLLLERLEAGLESRGTPLGGKDAQAPKREVQLKLLEGLVTESIISARGWGTLVTNLPSETVEEAMLPASDDPANDPANAGDNQNAIPARCTALPVYERLWELYKSDEAFQRTEDDAEGKQLVVQSVGSDEDAMQPGRPTAAGSPTEEDAEQALADEIVDAPPLAEDVAPAQKGVLLEFNFGAQSGSKKKKHKVPKAVAKRLQAGHRKQSAAMVPTASLSSEQGIVGSDKEDFNPEDEVGAAGEAEEPPLSKPSAGTWWESSWQWRSDILEILRLKGGVAKLKHPQKPNTAAIGNWAIIAAFKSLTADSELASSLAKGSLTVRPIMGRGKARWPGTKDAVERGEYAGLRESDSPSSREDAWRLLRNAFMTPGHALIFHLRNHYALIFALREWEEEEAGHPSLSIANSALPIVSAADGEAKEASSEACVDVPTCSNCTAQSADVENSSSKAIPGGSHRHRLVRQLLTARRGQRPSVWLDFEEAVKTMLDWEGYKIIQVQLKDTAAR